MAGRLEGKVVLISGGASGIGEAHARVFAAEGAKVLIGDIQEKMGRDVADSIGVTNSGGQAAFTSLDVSSEASWGDAVKKAVNLYGKLTTLVNNAGIGMAGGVTTESQASWDKTIAVNQTGVWYGMKTAIPEILKAGGGAIVNISSVYGIIGSPGMLSYHASKGAVRLMSKAAALEYATQGIRINSVHPGIIATPLAKSMPQEFLDDLTGKTPIGRLGKPEEIANGSLFLCSDEASFVTGAELVIDGGWTTQ
ncbi:MAG: glucose 1-dehydrogenase [Alphaproteobacteria bacterium]|nr:glucose 1-dehydrogenase [Alphaproteobacteria bacterium]